MKRLEHSDLIEACMAAIQRIADEGRPSFGKGDVIKLVLEQHPKADRVRLDGAAAKCLRAMERHPPKEQVNAIVEDAKRHAETLPPEEGFIYMQGVIDWLCKMGERQLVEVYQLKVGAELLKRYGDKNMHDLVLRIGEEEFLAACRDQLRRDGHIDVVTIPVPGRDLVYPIETFMEAFRIEAGQILRPKRVKVKFYFPTGPEEAA